MELDDQRSEHCLEQVLPFW
jgi:hypothetical protein